MLKSPERGISPEKKESEQFSPVYFVYRDNDLFKKWIPQITETLKGMDRKVGAHSFPAGTEREEMKKWLQENKDVVADKNVITDGTISNILDQEALEGKMEHIKRLETLDRMFDKAVKRIILGDMKEKSLYEIEKSGIEIAEEAFPKIIKQVLKNKENIPQKVYIIANDHLFDHGALRESSDEICSKEQGEKLPAVKLFNEWMETKDLDILLDSLKKRLVELGISRKMNTIDNIIENTKNLDDNNVSEFKREFKREEMAPMAAEVIKDWLIEGGISENDIEIRSEAEYQDEDDKEGNWIIANRHTYPSRPTSKHLRIPKNAVSLTLPLTDFYESANKAGLIEVEPDELKKEIEKELNEEFDGEEK